MEKFKQWKSYGNCNRDNEIRQCEITSMGKNTVENKKSPKNIEQLKVIL